MNIYNKRGQSVGTFNPETKLYWTIRDAKQGQIFLHPKHYGIVAINIDILKDLLRQGCKEIQMLILNFETKAFKIGISIQDFLVNSERFNFDKKGHNAGFSTFYSDQRGLSIQKFNRL